MKTIEHAHLRINIKQVALRELRFLAGRFPCHRVDVWRSDTYSSWCEAGLVLTLDWPLYSTPGSPRVPRPLQSYWASFSVLCESLRNWRNLKGVKLYIDGKDVGEVNYGNIHLQLGSSGNLREA
jgi:hypothetical protein